ncbi:MAG: hypothetical protein U0270_07435 [Labilithrix sp.]
MIRAGVFALTLASLGSLAPFQCGGGSENAPHQPDAGDALWDLAQDFHKQNNEPAARATLKYLVDHFPSNRHAPAARDELAAAK